MPLPIGTTLGPYQILEFIGEGGMGEVYRARDSRLGRIIALKTLPPDAIDDPERKRRLLTEARAACAINHPSVTQVYDVGESNGSAFIAMEYVEGISLAEKLRQGPLPIAEILAAGEAIANGLAAAHRQGIVHRDIKPENIIITPDGAVKLLDFGLAKLTMANTASDGITLAKTRPGLVMGTVYYMSPEQALGREVGPPSDIFSLGAVLYHAATGARPFSGESIPQIIDRVVHAEPPPLNDYRRDIPLELQRLIRRCLAKSIDERYSAADLARALGELARSEVVAGPQKIPVAILPFDDLSPTRDNEYFSDGLTEEITADLSNIASLAVVSRTSASRYKHTDKEIRTIAAELNVRYILEGSVRKAGDALRITAQLIDAATDSHIWAEKYKGSLRDVFDIQEQVARQIAEALRLKLTPQENVTLGKRSTLDAEAFDLYWRARHLLVAAKRSDLLEARSLFEQAIARDPRYAAAHAGHAEACAMYYADYQRNEELLERAIESALKGLMYDANSAEAYVALALAYLNRGQLEDALSACRRAIELDPGNYAGYWHLGRIYYLTGRTAEAVEQLQQAIRLNRELYPAYFTLRMVCQSIDREDIYRPYLTALIHEVLPFYLEKHPQDARARNCYGMELTQAGRSEEGLVQVQKALELAPDDPLILYTTACYFSLFGDRQYAIELLRQAIAAGYSNFAYLEQDPDLRPLHSEPAYIDLLRRHRPSGR